MFVIIHKMGDIKDRAENIGAKGIVMKDRINAEA